MHIKCIMLVLLWLGTTGYLQLDDSHFISVSIFITYVMMHVSCIYLNVNLFIPVGLGHYRSIQAECVTFIRCHFICN